MLKYLQAVVKECREVLEKDFAGQSHAEDRFSVKERALAFLMELAIIRCFEEQIWKIPTRFILSSSHEQNIRQYLVSRQLLQSELPFPLQILRTCKHFPANLKAVLHHFVITIPPDEWRSEHILGWIYQYFLENTPEQKQHGQFYTPEAVAGYIVSRTLDMAQHEGLDPTSPSFSLLDLACGSGAFALRAFERLYEYYRQEEKDVPRTSQVRGTFSNIPQQILENHLFLVDNDPWACQIAAINLYLKAKKLEPDCSIRQMNIFCADALRRKLFTRKYDVVVGNPPYIVINQLRTPKELVSLYKSYQTAAFKINTFALFVERGIELLKPRGILGMIVPNTFLTQIYFEPLRKYILETSKIRHILDTKRMFDNASVENGILLLQREQDATQRSLNVIECSAKNVNDNGRNHARKMLYEPQSAGLTANIPQYHFEKTPFNMFNVHIDEPTFALMEKITNGNSKLGEICESHDGVNPGNAKRKLIVSEKLDETCKKVLNGKDIGRYWLKWGGLYVRYNRDLLTKGDNVRWGHRLSLDSEKILTRQTADRIIGTFENGGYYTTNSIHTTILQDGGQGFYLKYILALLNSKLLSFYYRKLISEAGQLFSQVKLVNLRQLPLKHAPITEQTRLIRYVDEILSGMDQNLLSGIRPLAHGPQSFTSGIQLTLPSLAFHDAKSRDEQHRCEILLCRLREKDDQLDQKIYELYDLTAEEIQLIEREMGPGVTRYPRISVDDLEQEIPPGTFQHQYEDSLQKIFQMAEYYRVHPESLLELRRKY